MCVCVCGGGGGGGNHLTPIAVCFCIVIGGLLAVGANPGLCGESKVRPFDLAEEEGNRAVARLIDTYTHAHTLEP